MKRYQKILGLSNATILGGIIILLILTIHLENYNLINTPSKHQPGS